MLQGMATDDREQLPGPNALPGPLASADPHRFRQAAPSGPSTGSWLRGDFVGEQGPLAIGVPAPAARQPALNPDAPLTWVVEALLGSGRLVRAYEVRSLVEDRRFVLKILQDPSPDREARLADEAWLLTHLSHPGLVRGHGPTRLDGALTAVVDPVEGVSLDRVLSQHRRLPPDLARCVAASLAELLGALHTAPNAQGEPLHLVHRGLNPDDVILQADGQVVLVDLGQGKGHFADRQALSRGIRMKDIARSGPTQPCSGPPNPRLDSYGLGALFYELVRGERLPQPGSGPAGQGRVHQAVRDSKMVSSAVQAELLRALAWQVTDRPTPAELAARLRCDPGPLVRWAKSQVPALLSMQRLRGRSGGGLIGRQLRGTLRSGLVSEGPQLPPPPKPATQPVAPTRPIPAPGTRQAPETAGPVVPVTPPAQERLSAWAVVPVLVVVTVVLGWLVLG